MLFKSTRSLKDEISFRNAIFQGLAPDGGLYLPVEKLNLTTLFKSFSSETSFLEIAGKMIELLFNDTISGEKAEKIARQTFSFSPKIYHCNNDHSILELFHGPTCAFKDYGACFLASMMEEFLKSKSEKILILTATSGDTGSAVARAFKGKKNIEVVILYPSKRISPLQEKQLTTVGGNVTALEVKGSFDDCQKMVKEAFLDKKLTERLNLTSANSINIGRLIPQSFYYIYAYSKLKEKNENIYFCVPSGNFGNLTAGILAYQWGLQVKGFIAATNANDIIPEYLRTSIFSPKTSLKTLSNAMDVGDPSNFERLLKIFNNDVDDIRSILTGISISDDETLETIREFYSENHLFIDPHTAVGFLAAKRFVKQNNIKDSHIITLSTAHPGKFSEIVKEATGEAPGIPPALSETLDLEKKSILINNGFKDLLEYLMDTFKR